MMTLRRALLLVFRHRAHMRVYRAVRAGAVTRPAVCAGCGRRKSRIEGHHEDYEKALTVDWFCVSCHQRRHNALRRFRLFVVMEKYIAIATRKTIAAE